MGRHARRSGLALRRYTGEHRQSGFRFTPDDVAAHIAANAQHTRRTHLQSLRRPFDPIPQIPVFLGARMTNLQFFGVVPSDPDEPLTLATLTFEPSETVDMPALLPTTADDAPTGPLMTLQDVAGTVDWMDDLAAHCRDTQAALSHKSDTQHGSAA